MAETDSLKTTTPTTTTTTTSTTTNNMDDQKQKNMIEDSPLNTQSEESTKKEHHKETNHETPSDPLSFLSDICGRLKTLKRTGWIRHNIPFPESDSDHMHRCAMCTLLLSQYSSNQDMISDEDGDPHKTTDHDDGARDKFHPKHVNQTKLLKMALTHDLCESLAGDITPFCSKKLVQSKHDKERKSMETIQNIIGNPLGKELYDLWEEYEKQTSIEAIYCKDIDKFEMVMQAFEYEKHHLKQNTATTSTTATTSDNYDTHNKIMMNKNSTFEDTTETQSKKRKVQNDTNQSNMNTNELYKQVIKNYSTEDKILDEPLRSFFKTTNSCLKTPLFRRLDRELRSRREKYLIEKGWHVTDQERQMPST